MNKVKTFLLEVYLLLAIYFLIIAFARQTLFDDLTNSCIFTVIFSVITFLFIIFVCKLKSFSFPVIFLAITFLFTTTSPILFILYGVKGLSEWRFIDLVGINKALVLINLMYTSFYIGISFNKTLIKYGNSKPFKSSMQIIARLQEERILNIIGFGLLFISFICILIPTLEGNGLMTFIKSSYHEYHDSRLEGSVSLLFTLAFSNFLPWSIILITIGSNSIKQFKLYVFFFALPFIIIILLTGDRSSAFPPIVLLISIFYIKYHTITKISWRKIVLISIICLYLIPVIRVTRTIPISQWNSQTLISVITFQDNTFHSTDTENLNIITSTMYSVSEQLQSLVGTMKLVPDKAQYRYGFDYFVRPTIVAIPFLEFIISIDFHVRGAGIWVQPTQWFTYYYNTRGTGLGYLQVAEAYLNFGPLGIFVIYIILGFCLTKFWFKALFEKLPVKQIAFWLLFFNNVLNWIRNDATGQLRNLTWAWVIIYGGFAVVKYFQSKKISRGLPYIR